MLKLIPKFKPAGMIILLLLCTSCARYLSLTPAPEASRVAGMKRAATASTDGVQVTVQTRVWRGNPAIKEWVTPVGVSIANNTKKNLSIRLRDFVLMGNSGKRYAALPPVSIEGAVKERVDVPYTISPFFYYDGFWIAPYYSRRYPRLRPYGGYFFYDHFYYNQYYSYWARRSLPTPRMLSMALPEGVLKPGGRLEGIVYFEKINPGESQVRFNARMFPTGKKKPLGAVTIPLTVKK